MKQEAAETIRHVVNITASGERAVAIDGNVSGSTISTGDQTKG